MKFEIKCRAVCLSCLLAAATAFATAAGSSSLCTELASGTSIRRSSSSTTTTWTTTPIPSLKNPRASSSSSSVCTMNMMVPGKLSSTLVTKSSSLLLSSIGHLRGGALRGGKATSEPKTWLVGQISSAWKVLRSESGNACHVTEAAFKVSDLVFILCFAFLPEAIFRFINNRIVNKTLRRDHPLEFEDTPYLAPICTSVCQVGQISLLVYFGELFMVFLNGLGVNVQPKMFATLVYNLYSIHIVCKLKDRVLNRAFRRLSASSKRDHSSRKLLYARTLDAAIYLIGALIFLDANNIDVGMAIQSLLTVGGISSVVIGFALKEPVTEIIQGTSVLLSNKFIPGDTIRLADGTCGKVQRFEWTDVTMQGDDNTFVRIPHSQLAKTRIVNLSRMPCSQVAQEIRLPNRGSAKIQQVLDDIKREIQISCLALDESQPFLVHWTSFEKPDNVVITIQCHFRIPLLSAEYWVNRQNVLMAINRAIERYNS